MDLQALGKHWAEEVGVERSTRQVQGTGEQRYLDRSG